MKSLVFLIILFIFIGIMVPVEAFAQNKFMGNPVAVNYDTYLDGWFSYRITQDARGLIYVLLGRAGIDIYSGSEIIERIEAPIGSNFHSIFAGPSGRIYVGGADLGYYFPGPSGRYEYHSLEHLLPGPLQINGSNFVKYIFMHEGAIVFAKDDSFYYYKDNSIRVVSSAGCHASGTIKYRGDLYNMNEKGLVVFQDGQWETVPNGDFFKGKNIAELIEYSHDAMLVVTFKHGLYLLREDEIIPFAPEALDYDKIAILSALKLSDGSFAFGTGYNGLIIINPSGELIYHFNKENILKPNSQIWNIYEDRFGNIWLVREWGLFKIEWKTPYSRIDEMLGLEGYGITAQVIGEKIYLGTNSGLYVGEYKWPLDKLSRVEEIAGAVQNIRNINGDLLICGDGGLFQLVENKFILVSKKRNWWHLTETKNPNILIGGNWYGIHRLEKTEGLWSELTTYKDSEHLFPLVFDKIDQLWAISPMGVHSLSITEDYRSIAPVNFYDSAKGLPYRHINVPLILENQLVCPTPNGIYEYDRKEDLFKSSEIWNKRFGSFAKGIRQLKIDGSGNVYYLNNNSAYPRRLKRDQWDQYSNEPNLLTNIPIDRGEIRSISILDDKNILFTYDEGFIHYDVASQNAGPNEVNLLIRYVKLTRSDSVIFGGHFTHNGQVVNGQPSSHLSSIPYNENSLLFGYSAVEFNNYSQTYRYQLVGYNDEWSSWTNETQREFMNLREGDYTFRVEAQSVNGDLLPIQTYNFIILPPWYRTWFAYSAYSLVVLGLIGFLFVSHQKKNKKQISHLENKYLESEVNQKQTQLATTAMHLIEKNDFIRSIKTRINEILTEENENVNKKLKRIIREIEYNTQQEDIWKDFERYFDAVHTGFLKKLQKDYPNMTPQEVKLSAYLRMNLSTKEIANLMQITARSVEVSRYRLRKKLGLDSEVNLTSFMMNY